MRLCTYQTQKLNNGMHAPKPTFLIIGAQKCGTTWLHRHLREHPGVFMPAEKELEFFSYQDQLAKPGFNGYLAHFLKAGATPAVGEATAGYFWTRTNSRWSELPDGFQTDIPKTVHRHLGEELKLIVALRNPVKRAVSAYLHYLAMGEIAPDANFAQAMSYGGLVDMGFYARHLRNWQEYYPAHQIKVLILESDIRAKPVETLAELCRFLAIPAYDFGEKNVRKTVFAGTRRVINDHGVFVAVDETLTNSETGWHKDGYKDDSGQYWRQIIAAECLQQLNEIFLAEVRDLDRLLGTRLVQGWQMQG